MRKEKHNKYADKVAIGATLDFHDRGILTEKQVGEMLSLFIHDCVKKGHHTVLVITGKGLHSDRGPRVKLWVEVALQKSEQVMSYKEARRDRGGGGAYEVLL